MQVTLNSLNLNTGWYSLEEIQFDSSPPLEFSDLSFASADGAKFISSKYTPKTLTLRGRITQSTVALLEAEMDNFKKTLLKDANINLNFSYADNYRQYIGNVQNLILSRKHFNITYVPFEITFIAEDPPFAFGIDSLTSTYPTLQEVFSADGITGNAYSHTLSFTGTAPPLAKWTYLLDAVSGRISQMVFKSITTGKQMELNAALSAGDEVIIDEENLEVLLNLQNQEYEGVFPTFNLGSNELEWQIYGTGGVAGGGMYLDQSVTSIVGYGWFYSINKVAQTFQTGYSANLTRASVMLKKNSVGGSGAVSAHIYSVSASKPNTLLATSTTTVNLSNITTDFVWYDFNFAGQAIVSGTSYAIVITSTISDNYLGFAEANSYANGSMWYTFYSGIWVENPYNLDLIFKTYVTTTGVTTAFEHESSLKIEQKKRFL